MWFRYGEGGRTDEAKKKRPHRVKFLQLKKENRVKILQVIKNLNGCTVLNINMMELIILIMLIGIILCLIVGVIINLICILKISRQYLLKDGYNEAIKKINDNTGYSEAKMKYTVAAYQHYCQSLTKR